MPRESTPTPEIIITPEITITREPEKRLPDPPAPAPTLHLPTPHPPTPHLPAPQLTTSRSLTPHLPVSHPSTPHLPSPHPPMPQPAPLLTPQPSQTGTPNSLELHIPIPIPTPPTPLPIVVAYPLSQGIITPASESPSKCPEKYYRARCDTMQTDDSGIELEPVPAPIRRQKSTSERGDEKERVIPELHEKSTALEREFEVLDMTDEERIEAQTVYLFRALNVPLNIHRLRAMRAKGRLPEPFLKFRYGSSHSKPSRISIPEGKENKDIHLTSILKDTTSSPERPVDADPESPTDMEAVQGESWYLPSATARRVTRGSSNREYYEPRETYWESTQMRELRHEEITAPQPVIPNYNILDQFPLPPSTVPSVAALPEQYTAPLPPAPSPTPSGSGRPLGYMYGPPKSLRRTPSCKSCSSSPANSSRALTPALPQLQSSGTGAYYAYDLLTPSAGTLPYSHGPSRPVSPKHPPSAWASHMPSRFIS